MRSGLRVLIIVVIAAAAFAATPARAGFYSCEQSPYLCYSCRTIWTLGRVCWPLPYGIVGQCSCADTDGCGLSGPFCEAIIVY